MVFVNRSRRIVVIIVWVWKPWFWCSEEEFSVVDKEDSVNLWQVGQRDGDQLRKGRSEDSRLGGRSRARARVEARTCDTQLTNYPSTPSTECHCGNIIVSPVFLASFIWQQPLPHFCVWCWTFSDMHSQKRNKPQWPTKLKSCLLGTSIIGKRTGSWQRASGSAQRCCMTDGQAKRRLPSSLRSPLVGQRRMIVAWKPVFTKL